MLPASVSGLEGDVKFAVETVSVPQRFHNKEVLVPGLRWRQRIIEALVSQRFQSL